MASHTRFRVAPVSVLGSGSDFECELFATVQKLRGFITSQLVQHGQSRSRCDDVMQETLLAAWKNKASFDPSRSLEVWMKTIAVRKVIDLLRKSSTHEIVCDEGFESRLGTVSFESGVVESMFMLSHVNLVADVDDLHVFNLVFKTYHGSSVQAAAGEGLREDEVRSSVHKVLFLAGVIENASKHTGGQLSREVLVSCIPKFPEKYSQVGQACVGLGSFDSVLIAQYVDYSPECVSGVLDTVSRGLTVAKSIIMYGDLSVNRSQYSLGA